MSIETDLRFRLRSNAIRRKLDASDARIRTEICGCSICTETLIDGEPLADMKVFKGGELSYIQLAHEHCARIDQRRIDRLGINADWEWNR